MMYRDKLLKFYRKWLKPCRRDPASVQQPLYCVEVDTSDAALYFAQAKSWSDDHYSELIINHRRYRLLAVVLLFIIAAQMVALDLMLPLQHLQPLLIHHYQDGNVTIDRLSSHHPLWSKAQIESDIVRYVQNRESYDQHSFAEQYSRVLSMSSQPVAHQYMSLQDHNNSHSFIRLLGDHGYALATIDSVVFIDSKKWLGVHKAGDAIQLAQIDFSVSRIIGAGHQARSCRYRLIMAWKYLGMPAALMQRWYNWDGFTVTEYHRSRIL